MDGWTNGLTNKVTYTLYSRALATKTTSRIIEFQTVKTSVVREKNNFKSETIFGRFEAKAKSIWMGDGCLWIELDWFELDRIRLD